MSKTKLKSYKIYNQLMTCFKQSKHCTSSLQICPNPLKDLDAHKYLSNIGDMLSLVFLAVGYIRCPLQFFLVVDKF